MIILNISQIWLLILIHPGPKLAFHIRQQYFSNYCFVFILVAVFNMKPCIVQAVLLCSPSKPQRQGSRWGHCHSGWIGLGLGAVLPVVLYPRMPDVLGGRVTPS